MKIRRSKELGYSIKAAQSLINQVQDELTRNRLQNQLVDLVWQLQYELDSTESFFPEALRKLEIRMVDIETRLRALVPANARLDAPEAFTQQLGEQSPDAESLTKSVDETTGPIFTQDSITAVLEPDSITADTADEHGDETGMDTRPTRESRTPEQRTPAPDPPLTPAPAGGSSDPEPVPASMTTQPASASVTTNVLVGAPLPIPPLTKTASLLILTTIP